MAQPALHPVPDHRPTDRPTDHKSHFGTRRCTHRQWRVGIAGTSQMDDDGAASRPAAPLHSRREVVAAGQSGGSGQQREISGARMLRPTTRCDPCGAGLPGSRARRGSACAAGTRGSWRGDGCSAGTYACPCSRLSFSQCCGARRHGRGRARMPAGGRETGTSLSGRDPSRQNQRLASLSGRHAVTSMVLAYMGFLWQAPQACQLAAPER
jgi:hypothetical protein